MSAPRSFHRILSAIGRHRVGPTSVPSRLCHAEGEAAIWRVLQHIASEDAKSYARIQDRLLYIDWLSEREEASGTIAEVLHFRTDEPDFGPVSINFGRALKKAPPERWAGVAAHELGHVVTTERDRMRGNSPRAEWASELAANRYAFKWGFGSYIQKFDLAPDYGHGCGYPGQCVASDNNGKTRFFRVSSGFTLRVISETEFLKGVREAQRRLDSSDQERT